MIRKNACTDKIIIASIRLFHTQGLQYHAEVKTHIYEIYE
jgi:hypothetical protein